MRKIITCIILTLTLFGLSTRAVLASQNVAGESATLKFREVKDLSFDYRVYTLRKFLSGFNSPLTPYSPYFIKYADEYGLDWRMGASNKWS